MRRLWRVVAIGLFILLSTWLISQFLNQDQIGAIDKDTASIHMVRHVSGATLTFEEVARRTGNRGSGVVLTAKIEHPELLPKNFRTQLNSAEGGVASAVSPPAFNVGGDPNRLQLFSRNTPLSAQNLHWTLFFPSASGHDYSVEVVTPNPGYVSQSNGFIVTSRTDIKGSLSMTLTHFGNQFYGPRPPPVSSIWNLSEQWSRFSFSLSKHWYYCVGWMEVSLSSPEWSWAEFSVQSNFEKRSAYFGVGAPSVNVSDCPFPLWTEDGPYRVSAFASHQQLFEPKELRSLQIPDGKQVIPLNVTYSYGSAEVTFISLDGADLGNGEPFIIVRSKAAKLYIIVTAGNLTSGEPVQQRKDSDFLKNDPHLANWILGSTPTQVRESRIPLGLDTSFGKPTFDLKFILADETREFDFVAEPNEKK